MSTASHEIADDGEAVVFLVPDPTGLTAGTRLTLTIAELEAAYTQARARQLGADSTGSL